MGLAIANVNGVAWLYQSFSLLKLSICNLLKPSLPVALLCQLSIASFLRASSLGVIRTVHHGRGASSASRSAHAFYLYSWAYYCT